jgi:hypothetical protein
MKEEKGGGGGDIKPKIKEQKQEQNTIKKQKTIVLGFLAMMLHWASLLVQGSPCNGTNCFLLMQLL